MFYCSLCFDCLGLQTYFGVDVEAVSDPVKRNAVKTMIRTYGQTPQQLFRTPHPLPQVVLHADNKGKLKSSKVRLLQLLRISTM